MQIADFRGFDALLYTETVRLEIVFFGVAYALICKFFCDGETHVLYDFLLDFFAICIVVCGE